jgi:hypothetical protein
MRCDMSRLCLQYVEGRTFLKQKKPIVMVGRSFKRGHVEDRMARLGEISPIGWLFSLGRFSKIAEVAQILGLLFIWKKLCIEFDKNGLGYMYFGRFFWQTHLVTLVGE